MVARLRKSIEHTEQVKLVQKVRAFYPDIIIAAIPNGGDKGPRPTGTQPPIAVILDAALGVATHSRTGATSCAATRLDYSVTSGQYTEANASVPKITVWNHSESDEYALNTFGKAEWIDGHWWFMGDCGPMASR